LLGFPRILILEVRMMDISKYFASLSGYASAQMREFGWGKKTASQASSSKASKEEAPYERLPSITQQVEIFRQELIRRNTDKRSQ
jgi:hypothetical protein